MDEKEYEYHNVTTDEIPMMSGSIEWSSMTITVKEKENE